MLILAIALWAIAHSLLASLRLKDFLRHLLGDRLMRFYRLLYNLFAVISIAPVFYLMISLPDKPLYQVSPPWSYIMLAGQGLSTLFLVGAILQTDVFAFAGLRQLATDHKEGKLITYGLYRFVRHPLYTFSLLILWLSPRLSVNSFIVYLALTFYVLIGAFFEERKLMREFGPAYVDYRRVTPMLIPGLKVRRNK